MKLDDKLVEETKLLFDRDFLKELSGEIELSEEEEDDYQNRSDALIQEYGWEQVFKAWNKYLRENCNTAESALNFANLFWSYEGYVHPIPNPYDFLAWFYYQIDMEKYADDAITIMDSISIEILHRAGVKGIYWGENPYYVPEQDPKMLAAVEKIRNGVKK